MTGNRSLITHTRHTHLERLQPSEEQEGRGDGEREEPNGGDDGIGALLGHPRPQREHDRHVTVARDGRQCQHRRGQTGHCGGGEGKMKERLEKECGNLSNAY